MRMVLRFLFLFGLAALVAVFVTGNQGRVSVFWPPYQLDLALHVALLGLLLLVVLLYWVLRGTSTLVSLPERARRWRRRRLEHATQQGLLDALLHLAAGRYVRAQKAMKPVLSDETATSNPATPYAQQLRVWSHLLFAESAHRLQDSATRDQHLAQARLAAQSQGVQEAQEAVLLRALEWALQDRDVRAAQQALDELPPSVARRTAALHLRLKFARLSSQPQLALETARLLVKHRAFSDVAAAGLLTGLAVELVNTAGEPQQLQTLWSQQLDTALRAEPQVVLQAGQKMLALGGDVTLVLAWLWPIWVQCIASSDANAANHTNTTVRVRLAQLLQHSLAQTAHTPQAQQWLTRIEQAQMRHPADPLLQYLAGVVCMHLQLWGKAQQLLKQALPRLSDTTLQRTAWLALARLAEQRNDTTEANQAWRQAALL